MTTKQQLLVYYILSSTSSLIKEKILCNHKLVELVICDLAFCNNKQCFNIYLEKILGM